MTHRNATANDSISRSQLAAWGLLDQVLRMEAIDALLHQQPTLAGEDLQQLSQQWCQQQNINSHEELNHWCQQHGLSLEQWQRLIMRPKQWLRWCEQEFKGKIKTHFLKRKTHLDRVTYSLIRVKDEDLAWELFHRIKEGEECFRELAKAHSEGPERHSGGLLGPVPLSQPHPHLAELLRISEPGKLWQPKKLEGWWVIVRVEQHHGARFNDLNEHLSLELGELHLNGLIEQKKPKHPTRQDLAAAPFVAHPEHARQAKTAIGQSAPWKPLTNLHLLNKHGAHHQATPKQHAS